MIGKHSIGIWTIFSKAWAALRIFFEKGEVGYSPDKVGKSYGGLELKTYEWKLRSLTVSEVK